MSTVTTDRRIDLLRLGFPATMRQSGDTFEVEADQPQATLQAAVDACPLDNRDANAAAIRDKAAQALSVNKTYLALNNPTNAQNVTQVRALTRECNALIRLLLGLLDDASDT